MIKNDLNGTKSSDRQLYIFSPNTIRTMLLDMDKGILYNYHGQVAKSGEPTLDREVLQLLLKNEQNPNPSSRAKTIHMTTDEMKQIQNGIMNGKRYNYYMQPASLDEPTITLEFLDLLLQVLPPNDPMNADQQGFTFTTDDVKRIVKDINAIKRSGDKNIKIPREDTNQSGPQFNNPLHKQTFDSHLERMKPLVPVHFTNDGTRDMKSAVSNLDPFTFGKERKLPLGKNAQTADTILADKNEQSFPIVNSKQTEKKISSLESAKPIRSLRFTNGDIQRMKNGIKRGKRYNIMGKPASDNELSITLDWLNSLEKTIHKPSTKITDRAVSDIKHGSRIQFANVSPHTNRVASENDSWKLVQKDKLRGEHATSPLKEQDLTNDFNQPFTFENKINSHLDISKTGDATVTIDWQSYFKHSSESQAKETTDFETKTYTYSLTDILRMLKGMNNGLIYNYRGKVAQIGEPTISRSQLYYLITYLRPYTNSQLAQTPLDLQDTDQSMLLQSDQPFDNSVDQSPGLTAPTSDNSKYLLSILGQNGEAGAFKIEDLRRMIEELEAGKPINPDNLPPTIGDPGLSREELVKLLQELENAAGQNQTGAGDSVVDVNPVVEGTQPEQPPVTQPEQPPVTQPEQPPVTQPEQPPVTQPGQPPVTQPEQPPVTQPEQPPVAQPEQPPVTQPEQPPVTQPELPPVTQPEQPSVTQPEQPPVTQPEQPPVTQPEQPPVTQPEQPPVTQPEQPPVTQPEQPPVTQPEQPPVTQPVQPPVTQPEQPPVAQPEQPPVTQPEQPPVTQPEQPPVTQPEQPPVTQPEQPPVTQPEQPPVTQPEQPPVTQPEQPPVTQPEQPPVTQPEQPPVTQPEQPPVTQPVQPPVTQPEQPPVTQPEQPPVTQPEQPTGTQPGSSETSATTQDVVEVFIEYGVEGAPSQTVTFTRQQILDMIKGTKAGKVYSFYGVEGDTSLGPFTLGHLEGLIDNLDRKSLIGSLVPPDMFIRDDIVEMIRGTEQGRRYNLQGLYASPGEQVLPLTLLNWLLQQLPERPNIALNSAVELSSTANSIWTGANAVDGITLPDMSQNSCFMTNIERNPYLIIDLQGVYGIDSIVIHNTNYEQGKLAKNIEISTAVARGEFSPRETIPGSLLMETTVPFSPVQEAQYIKIAVKDVTPTALALCEVTVYGDYIREDLCTMSPCLNGGTCTNLPGLNLCICDKGWEGKNCEISNENIALGKPTELSSLFQNDLQYGGRKAVDGNMDSDMIAGSCFRTENQVRPWIRIDFGAVYEIQRIKLTNRGDCCVNDAQNPEVSTGLTADAMNLVYSQTGPIGADLLINRIPPGTQGQFVKIQLNDPLPSTLQLCEIEIYGKYVRADQCLGGNPCKNGGLCTNRLGMRNCICQEGFMGATCSFDSHDQIEPPNIGEDWRKARVDPTVCLEYGCNLPICYVPYKKDCKSFVVCQRTATNQFVAWKMRCAFGSFWGPGNTWTCERVEDLVQKGYTCPSDACSKNPNLETYADEDEQNCKTFWKCENGLSRPRCCPPGQRFNRRSLFCEDDPQETCRMPCPLTIEGCSQAQGRNVSFYDGNCRTYWNCANGYAHPVCCPARMSFDSALGQCVSDSQCSTPCPHEYSGHSCGKVAGADVVRAYKLRDGNCRTHMRCSADGKYDEPFCCSQEFYFDDRSERCEPVKNETDVCNVEKCPSGYKEDCRFLPIDGEPSKFYDTKADLALSCAPGATFAPELCTCEGNNMINEYKACKPEIWVKFNTVGKWNIKNYGDGTVSPYGDLTKNSTQQNITYGSYDGSSGVRVWRYAHIGFQDFYLIIEFRPVPSGLGTQILASNCMSVDNGMPSFEVSLDQQTSEIVFNGKTKSNSAVVSLPYDKSDWNTYTLVYDGENVAAKIQTGFGTGTQPMMEVIQSLRGEIVAGVGSFKFGPCMNEFSKPKENGFTGLVSEIKFAQCVDNKGRQFINDMLKTVSTG
ncbi:hypothetical protein ACF0H5_018185 [Mactra antiquata]